MANLTVSEMARRMGRKGGKARMQALSEEEHLELSAAGGRASWAGLSKEERSEIMKDRARRRRRHK